jgi:hypothetical protein
LPRARAGGERGCGNHDTGRLDDGSSYSVHGALREAMTLTAPGTGAIRKAL